MERYVCVHGHFYQPPRENAWLEAIEVQDSAYPYHDWNARVTAECYATNAVSRVLDGDGFITDIVNNYASISFNFGPTLLMWLEERRPDVYRSILEADRDSAARFSGHGSALAQCYNHLIMPLACRRDKVTQVRWGVDDFRHRFGRDPEGMWLPETAVDLETLDILAEHGIGFTILSPYQAARVRARGAKAWTDVAGGKVDPTMPYRVALPSGRSMTVLFYDGPVSRGIAFEGLLNRGEDLAGRLMGAFDGNRDRTQLVHIATDGESYGHHHRHGEMALSYALRVIADTDGVDLTNYGEFLERHPPDMEAEIIENSSWSCVHGVERWRSDCGCSSGGHPGWNQRWRGPLRAALDWLRDELAPRYEHAAGQLFSDPWEARDAYIAVVLDRSPESRQAFLSARASRPVEGDDEVRAWKLLELQRHAMLMYTSCGWFFDELSGIETVQVMQYAGRAVQLAADLFGDGLEPAFLERLAKAPSNIAEHGDGARIYRAFVTPAMVDLPKVGAHYAMASMFEDFADRDTVACYTVERRRFHLQEAGRARVVLGVAAVASEVTGEAADLTFGVLHFGDHNLNGGVRAFRGDEAFDDMVREVGRVFARADFPETLRLLEAHVGETIYSLRTLFRDEQRLVLDRVLEETLGEIEGIYRRIYLQNAPLMLFLGDLDVPPPRPFQAAAEAVLNADIRRAFEEQAFDRERVVGLMNDAAAHRVELDGPGLGLALTATLERMAEELVDALDLEGLERMRDAVALARTPPLEVNLWRTQNLFWDLREKSYPELLRQAEGGDEEAQARVVAFNALGRALYVRVG